MIKLNVPCKDPRLADLSLTGMAEPFKKTRKASTENKSTLERKMIELYDKNGKTENLVAYREDPYRVKGLSLASIWRSIVIRFLGIQIKKFEEIFSVFSETDYNRFRERAFRYLHNTYDYNNLIYHDIFVESLIEKFKQKHPTFEAETISSIKVLSLCLSLKNSQDGPLWNRNFAEIYKFSPYQINSMSKKELKMQLQPLIDQFNVMEREILKAIDYEIPTQAEIESIYQHKRNHNSSERGPKTTRFV